MVIVGGVCTTYCRWTVVVVDVVVLVVIADGGVVGIETPLLTTVGGWDAGLTVVDTCGAYPTVIGFNSVCDTEDATVGRSCSFMIVIVDAGVMIF